MDYDEVRRVHRLEKNSTQIAGVGSDFFLELRAFLGKERESYLSSLKNGSISKSRDYANLEEMAREIQGVRERKILNKALIASRTNEYSLAGMTPEEKALFQGVLKVLNSFKAEMSPVFEPGKKKQGRKEKDLKKLSLQILSDIPSFVGTDMEEYGPFSKGTSVELPKKTAELLVGRKLAVKN